MRKRAAKRMLLTSLLVVLAVPVGGAANAYWRGSGIGGGSETTGTAVAVTLSPVTSTAALYPGGWANVALTVSNPNASPVHIGSLALDPGQGASGFAVDASHSGCATSALSFTTQTNVGSGWTIPAKVDSVNGTLSVTLPNALGMGIDAANACQGASFTVYLAAGP
jgi:F0F1-type ATP synthase assembly protein I